MSKVQGKVQAKKIIQTDEKKVVQAPLPISDRATKRVIAPFVRIVRKDVKPAEVEESKQFSYYLQKKPSVLIRDLSSFLSDSVDLPSLLHETANVLKNVSKAAGVTLYMMDPANNEIYVSRKTPVEERHKIRWKIQGGTTVAAYVANKKEYVLVDDILKDDRFPEGIGYEGETIKSVLCVPVVTPDGECFAVIELNRQLFDEPFSLDDLKITVIVTGWMGAAIHQNSQRLALKRQQELNDYLLDLTKCYFGEKVVTEKLISEIVKFAKVTLGAERATFFIIDKDSEELVADMFDDIEEDSKEYKKATKVRFGKEKGIAAVVARTGVTVNVKDAYNDARFNKEIDQKTGFITRSILCMPIVGVDGILGVVQVVNKKSGGFFTNMDENLFKTFCAYSAIALHFSKVFKHTNSTRLLNNCFLTLLELQRKPCIHDIESLSANYSNVKIPSHFNDFNWYINPDDHSQMPELCLYMMLQLINESEVNEQELGQFILSVRKLYRKVPYHNFEHAFNTLHCMYIILKRNLLNFTHIEIKALLIAAICHDIDHPGFTSNFLCLTNDDLSYLYDDSVLPNHHCTIALQVFKDYKIFTNLSKEEKDLLVKMIREAILDSDLQNYFKHQTKLADICKMKSFNWNDELHLCHLRSIMMTASDLSGQCKSFFVAKRITDSVYMEYYRQGDLIKEIGINPLSIMDREKHSSLPEDQVRFLTVMVLPCVKLLKTILPNTESLYSDANLLRKTWQDIIDVRGKKCWRQDDSIVEKISA